LKEDVRRRDELLKVRDEFVNLGLAIVENIVRRSGRCTSLDDAGDDVDCLGNKYL